MPTYTSLMDFIPSGAGAQPGLLVSPGVAVSTLKTPPTVLPSTVVNPSWSPTLRETELDSRDAQFIRSYAEYANSVSTNVSVDASYSWATGSVSASASKAMLQESGGSSTSVLYCQWHLRYRGAQVLDRGIAPSNPLSPGATALKSTPDKFRQAFGDSYITTVHLGASAQLWYSAESKTSWTRTDVETNLAAALETITVDGKVKLKNEDKATALFQNARVSAEVITVGKFTAGLLLGEGMGAITGPDGLLALLRQFADTADAVSSATPVPFAYEMQPSSTLDVSDKVTPFPLIRKKDQPVRDLWKRYLLNVAAIEKIDEYVGDSRLKSSNPPSDMDYLIALGGVYAKEQQRIADLGNQWLALKYDDILEDPSQLPGFDPLIDDADAAKLGLPKGIHFSFVELSHSQRFKDIFAKYPRMLIIELQECSHDGNSPIRQTFKGSVTAIIDGDGPNAITEQFGFIQEMNQQQSTIPLGQVLYVLLPADGNWRNVVLRTRFEGGAAGQNAAEAFNDLKCDVGDFPAKLGDQSGQVQFAPQYNYGVRLGVKYTIIASD